MKPTKRLYLPIEKKREILALKWVVRGKRIHVSFVTLQNALNFVTLSPLANVLRAAAVERGAVLYDSHASNPTNKKTTKQNIE